eukprot:3340288-Alexandrium_andersonii.AAC.1
MAEVLVRHLQRSATHGGCQVLEVWPEAAPLQVQARTRGRRCGTCSAGHSVVVPPKRQPIGGARFGGTRGPPA